MKKLFYLLLVISSMSFLLGSCDKPSYSFRIDNHTEEELSEEIENDIEELETELDLEELEKEEDLEEIENEEFLKEKETSESKNNSQENDGINIEVDFEF